MGKGLRVAGLLVVGVLIFSSTDVLMTVRSQGAGASSVQCDVTHEGDLVIAGHQVFTIEDQTYCQTGNIYVLDNARLIVRNATLVMHMGFDGQYRIYVVDSAEIEMKNFKLESSHETVFFSTDTTLINITNTNFSPILLHCERNSKAIINNVIMDELKLYDSCSATVVDSAVNRLIWLHFGGTAKVELSKLSPGLFEAWDLHVDMEVVNVPLSLKLQDTYVGAWSIHAQDAANIVIRDSVLSSLAIVLDSARGVISEIKPGFYNNWDLHKEGGLGNTFLQLTLINVSISQPWVIYLAGACNLTIRDSIIVVDIPYGASNITIANSILTGPFSISEYWGNLNFETAELKVAINIYDSTFSIKGNVSFSSDTRVEQWSSAEITRTYDVVVQNQQGIPLSGVSLQIEAPDGQLSIIGRTDAEGKVSFDLTFNDDNYQDEWTLKAALPDGEVITRSIKFLTDTPIVITPEQGA